MKHYLITVILSLCFVTGCETIPGDEGYPGVSNDSVEREDEILRQQPTTKRKQDPVFRTDHKETPLNNSVIVEDSIIDETSPTKQLRKIKKAPKEDEKDEEGESIFEEELDDELDHDAIDIDYRKKKKDPPSLT